LRSIAILTELGGRQQREFRRDFPDLSPNCRAWSLLGGFWSSLIRICSPLGSARTRRLAAVRGFTLIELMVVVVLVAILAAIAVPGVVERLRQRRVSEAAQKIAALYRGARIRALGRGSAVLVRWKDARFTVYEAVQGATAVGASCALIPSSSCLRADWANDGSDMRHEVGSFRFGDRAEYADADVAVTVNGTDGSSSATLDVCFSPAGQTFSRTNLIGSFTPLNGVVGAAVTRAADSSVTHLTHRVAVLPNGMAAVSAKLEGP
jgi:type IV fimbrial biogenesis protein FimT